MATRIRFICLFFALFCLLGAQANGIFFTDDFSKGKGRPESGWKFDTTDTSFWSRQNGWLTSGNGDNQIVRADGYSFGVIETPQAAGWDDYEIGCRFWMKQTDGHVALVGRWRDRRNHYRAVLEISQASRVLRLEKVVDGKASLLASRTLDATAPAIAQGGPEKAIEFALSLVGPDLSVKLGGSPVLKAKDTNFASGTAGVGQRRNEVFFSDVRVAEKLVAQAALVAPKGASAPAGAKGKFFGVQIYADSNPIPARSLVRELKTKGYHPFILPGAGGALRVIIGPFSSAEEATRIQQAMILGEEFTFARVVDLGAESEIAKVALQAPPVAADTRKMLDTMLEDMSWDSLTPSQRDKVVDMVMRRRAARSGLQSVERILQIKQDIEKMTATQQQSLVALEEKIDKTASSSAGMRNEIEALSAKVDQAKPLEGVEEILRRERENELIALQAKARALTDANEVDRAYDLWMAVLRKAPDNDDAVKEATRKIEDLKAQIGARTGQEKQQMATQADKNLQLYMKAGGGAIGVLFILLAAVYFGGRRRYAQVTRQLQEEAINPLMALESRTRGGVPAPSSGMDLPGADQSLLEETDSTGPEFMVPDKETPSPEPPPVAPADDPMDMPLDLSGGDESESEADAFGMGNLSFDDPSEEEETSAETSADAGGADDFLMSFGDEDEDDSAPTETAVEQPAADSASDEAEEDMGFSFADFSSDSEEDESTSGAITATEVAETPEAEEEDIVFSFDDTPSDETQAEEPVSLDQPDVGSEDSMYESIPLDDLTFDVGSDTQAEAISLDAAPEAGAEGANPLDGGLDLSFDMPESTVSDQTPTVAMPEANPLMDGSLDLGPVPGVSSAPVGEETEVDNLPLDLGGDAEGEPADNVLFRQDFSADAEGDMPSGWSGENVEGASLTVVENSDAPGSKCLQFKKTAGATATAFACKFPEVRGRLCVEFDIRCVEKNKHLLGFYIEADSDFRRSVHTVVQFTDPSRPAHLRIFTRPTPYEMGAWRHVKYIVNLEAGLVDGYVGDELVAEGIRMGTKTPVLNTLSIRDNSETTGTLLIGNLTITQMADDE